MGPGNGTSFRLGPQCTGSESNVLFCPLQKKWAEDECSHSHDIGVKCTTTALGRICIKYIFISFMTNTLFSSPANNIKNNIRVLNYYVLDFNWPI